MRKFIPAAFHNSSKSFSLKIFRSQIYWINKHKASLHGFADKPWNARNVRFIFQLLTYVGWSFLNNSQKMSFKLYVELMLEQFVPLCRCGTYNKFPPQQIRIIISHYAATWLSASKYFSKVLWSQDLLIWKRWWFAKPTSINPKACNKLSLANQLFRKITFRRIPACFSLCEKFQWAFFHVV